MLETNSEMICKTFEHEKYGMLRIAIIMELDFKDCNLLCSRVEYLYSAEDISRVLFKNNDKGIIEKYCSNAKEYYFKDKIFEGGILLIDNDDLNTLLKHYTIPVEIYDDFCSYIYNCDQKIGKEYSYQIEKIAALSKKIPSLNFDENNECQVYNDFYNEAYADFSFIIFHNDKFSDLKVVLMQENRHVGINTYRYGSEIYFCIEDIAKILYNKNYTELVNKYPLEITYIPYPTNDKGCIYPFVGIDEFNILSHNYECSKEIYHEYINWMHSVTYRADNIFCKNQKVREKRRKEKEKNIENQILL